MIVTEHSPPDENCTYSICAFKTTHMDFRYNDDVTIPARNIALPGKLSIPFQARSIIIFSHGSGSSRLSRRNKMVADYLHGRNIGTLLFDLLTAEEDIHPHNRFSGHLQFLIYLVVFF